MTVIHLGVVDIPYLTNPEGEPAKETRRQQSSRIKKNRKAKTEREPDAVTTGDVAEILEAKYHVMEIFAEENLEHFGNVLAHSVAGALESVMQGAPGNGPPPYAEAEGEIKEAFDNFITLRLMDDLGYPGVPTQASLDGVSHRFKHPYAKRPSRPSFVDTGLYLASFVAEVDG